MMITLDATLKDVYTTPIGHDVLTRLALTMGFSARLFEGRLGMLKLKTIKKLTGRLFDEAFFDTLMTLINSESEQPPTDTDVITPAWWKEAVFYQIYPRTFCDSNGDGIGDLQGMLSKLDYLKALGVDALWLSPIYDSPNDDNGYDIRDYYAIHEDYGSLADFRCLLVEAHKRGMKVIMDLVVNHTSDEHAWFQEALHDPDSPYRDYYFLKESQDVPNNWTSFFSGSAWNHYEEEHLWGLHLFSKKQMDLNWENPALRQEIIRMINWWLDLGIDGFRLDVINYISKAEGLPNGNKKIGEMMGYTGIEHYFYGPHLHDYLREIREKAFAPHQAFSVGEVPGLGMKMGQMVTHQARQELDMIFTFDHLESPGHTRFEDYRYDLNAYKDFVHDWMCHYGRGCWMSLFYNNHDNPKMSSKIDPTGHYRKAIQSLLVIMQMTMKGTPFIYQGEEMGLSNYDFQSIDELSDVESLNLYQELIQKMSAEEAFQIIKAGTRDHARILLPWHEETKALLQEKYQPIDEDITSLYQRMIALRHEMKVLVYGDYQAIDLSKDHYAYARSDQEHLVIVDCNLSDHKIKALKVPEGARLLEPSDINDANELAPYEARLYQVV